MAENINPIIWFEIPVLDFARGKAFYESVFSLKLDVVEMGPRQMAMFSMEMGVPGIGGSLVKDEGFVPSQIGTLVYFSVTNIAETLDKVIANKGKMLVPKTDIGEYGFFAHFEDSEGNRIGLHTMQ
ncbi:MAG: Glyoxalase-like domain containing protein [Anaerosporomusa subterranea]|jgi:predicted enzyme related to lactoylglutathione lyase|nr:Glyoxalase-like domain containing protein [Anaerosporomusa subterranea]